MKALDRPGVHELEIVERVRSPERRDALVLTHLQNAIDHIARMKGARFGVVRRR